MAKGESSNFQGESLAVARAYRALTVSELSKLSGVSRQIVTSLERGATRPFPRAVEAVAEALGFPVEFFFAPVPMPQPEVLHFRKGSRVRTRAIAKARAHAGLAAKVLAAAQKYSRRKFELRLPRVEPVNSDSIESAAEALRQAVGLSPDAPIGNAIQTVEATGALVVTTAVAGVPVDGFCWNECQPLVVLSTASPWSRRRHSVMHELGHLVLHSNSRPEQMEAQAHRFAGAVLAPRVAFWREFPRATWRFDWAALLAMKERWGMSLQALLHRAFDLNIIGQAQYRVACIHVRQSGWRLNEPGEIEPEEPRFCELLMRGLAERGYLDALAADCRLFRTNLEEILNLRFIEDVTGIQPLVRRDPPPTLHS